MKTQENEDNCWMNVAEDPGGMVTETGGKRLPLKTVPLGQGRQKKRWWRARVIKTTQAMLLHEKD